MYSPLPVGRRGLIWVDKVCSEERLDALSGCLIVVSSIFDLEGGRLQLVVFNITCGKEDLGQLKIK